MNLVIAEKNEAARDIAAAICGTSQKPSDIKLPAFGNGYAVYAASGHLLELVEPAEVDPEYAVTELEDLPIRIYPWPKAPQGDYQAKKLADIADALGKCDGKVFHAGDADDEGQLIVDEILEHCGWDPKDARVMRVYVNDNLPQNIRKAFEHATPNADHVSDGYAAQARSLGDFCFGINESRLASTKLKARLSVGRVQTPTLGLVVDRDRSRENHERRAFYELKVTCADEGGNELVFSYRPADDKLEDGKHCFDKGVLEKAAAAVEGRSFECEIGVSRKRKAAPLPYNLTDLTADMSKRFGMTANDVMEATQALRDTHKAITYNRAESRHLPSEAHAQAPDVLPRAVSNIAFEYPWKESLRHAAFDDSKVSAHHGIIPQATALDLSVMPERERNVYTAIATRYICLFMDDLVYDEATAPYPLAAGDALEFKGRYAIEAGWSEAAPSQWNNVSLLDGAAPEPGMRSFKVAGCELVEKETTPPAAFTDGTLTVAMSNIARYVKDEEVKRILKEKDAASTTEHGSIGTAATRKDIIEALIARGYVVRDGRGKLTSTEKGRKFYDLVPDSIKGADMTARWYLIQKDVAEGAVEVFAVMDAVCEEFERHKDSAYEGKSLKVSAGPCPKCGEPVEQRGSIWSCASNKAEKRGDGTWVDVAGCGFKILPFCGKKFSEKQAASLLAGKKVALRGCVSRKTGKKFDCKVALVDGELKPEFENKGIKGGKTAYSNKTASFSSMAGFKKRKGGN